MAECGTCTLCCKLLGVIEIQKPPNRWCSSCSPGRGCSIYADRPAVCRDFECGWLANNGAPELRPDRIHMIVTGESDKINAYVVHVDPAYPRAPKTSRGKMLIQHLTTQGRRPNVVLVTGDRLCFLGSNPRETARLLDLAETAGQPLT